MSGWFGSTKIPEITTVAPPKVTETIPTAVEATATKKKKLAKGKTRRGTILTSEQGILTAPPVELKTLLGR